MAGATTTPEAVCNLALSRVGCNDTIDDLDSDNTPESRACLVSYAAARDALLEMLKWNFAQRRAVLALVADAEFSGWDYVYAVPSDCITAHFLYDGVIDPASRLKTPFKLELGDDSSGNPTLPVILTNLEDAELFYTAQVTTVALWSPLFVQALSWLIACDLVTALPKKLEWRASVTDGFARAFALAGARNNSAGQLGPPPESEFITERG